jgi:hypothetical protein
MAHLTAVEEASVLIVTSTPGGLHVGKIVGTGIPNLVWSRFGEVVEEEGRFAQAEKSKLTLPSLLALLKSLDYLVDGFSMAVTNFSSLPVREVMLSKQPTSKRASKPAHAGAPASAEAIAEAVSAASLTDEGVSSSANTQRHPAASPAPFTPPAGSQQLPSAPMSHGVYNELANQEPECTDASTEQVAVPAEVAPAGAAAKLKRRRHTRKHDDSTTGAPGAAPAGLEPEAAAAPAAAADPATAPILVRKPSDFP